MKADLHVHTTASDGIYTPAEVVELAYKTGLKAIAITDHDTFDGIQTAQRATEEINIEVIPGIEITTIDNEQEIHILGYFVDQNYPPLNYLLDKVKDDKKVRIKKMVEKLQAMGLSITYSEVNNEAGGINPGRPHIARVLIKYGYVKNIPEAFEKYLGHLCPAFVPRYHVPTLLAIEYLTKAKGIAVLAHPQLEVTEQQLDHFIKGGLKGIEVFHPKHPIPVQDYYLSIANDKDLIITGGSDFHGDPDHHLNVTTVSYQSVEQLKNARVSNTEK